MNFLVYVYCVVAAGDPAAAIVESGQVPGIVPGMPLFAVRSEELVACVSRVPSLQFDEQPLNEITTSLSSVAPFALKHHEAIARLLPDAAALVPMTMGAIYRSESRVASFLEERREELLGLLAAVRGREEWGVKVFRQDKALLEAAGTTSEQAKSMDAAAGSSTPGKAYLLRRQREKVVEAEAERIAGEGVRTVLDSLRALSADMREESLPAVEGDGPRLAAKASFLVERDRAAEFRHEVERISLRFARIGLPVEIDGPWAPYSFVSLKSEPSRSMAGRA